MSIDPVRSRALRPQVVLSGRALAAAVVIAYLLVFAASLSHMSARERTETLLPWSAPSTMVLRIQTGSIVCDFRNVVIGDGAVRTGSRCVTEKHWSEP
jgi:hypothetical protein